MDVPDRLLGAGFRRALPPSDDPDCGRRANLVLLVVPLMGVGVPVFFALYLALGVAVAAGALAALAPVLAAAPILLRQMDAIGAKAREAHRQVRLVLDTVAQGLILVDRHGRMSGEHSAEAENVLGPLSAGTPIWDLLGRFDEDVGAWLALAWPTLSDPVAPPELALTQLPAQVRVKKRTFAMSYRPVESDQGFGGVVIGLRDVSAEREAEEAVRAQRELHGLATRLVRDPAGMREFLEEGRRTLDELRSREVEPSAQFRLLHTLKGNAALMGLERLSEVCHRLEERLEQGRLRQEDLEPLWGIWLDVDQRLRSMLGRAAPEVEVSRDEHAALLLAFDAGEPRETLRAMVASWHEEPVSRRLERLGEQAKALAFRLGKGALDLEIAHGGLRLPSESYASLWSALVHVVRNAVDHGLEETPTRVRLGKPRRGKLRLEAERLDGGGVRIAISDDGRGVDWDLLRAKSAERGLPPDLSDQELFFAGGLSSRDQISSVSGRGVGTAAVLQVVADLGGTAHVRSARGEGTTVELCLPARVEPDRPSGDRPLGRTHTQLGLDGADTPGEASGVPEERERDGGPRRPGP